MYTPGWFVRSLLVCFVSWNIAAAQNSPSWSIPPSIEHSGGGVHERSFITRDNHTTNEFPFRVTAKHTFDGDSEVRLTVTKANRLRHFNTVFLFDRDDITKFWVQISPVSNNDNQESFLFNVSKDMLQRLALVLACSRRSRDFASLSDKLRLAKNHPEAARVMHLEYGELIHINLSSFIDPGTL